MFKLTAKVSETDKGNVQLFMDDQRSYLHLGPAETNAGWEKETRFM